MRIIDTLTRIAAACLILCMVLPPDIVSAEEAVKTKIRHTGPDTYIPDFRIVLTADIKDEAGIREARCYFRQKDEAEYIFVGMKPDGDGTYEAVLPAPELGSGAIHYYILSVNGKNKAAKTGVFEISEQATPQLAQLKEAENQAPQEKSNFKKKLENRLESEFERKLTKYQTGQKEGTIRANTELPKAPSKVGGFSDTIEVAAVEESMRYALKATPIVAVSGGIGLGGIIAGLAIIGGGAALAGGGGGGGGGSSQAALTVNGVWQTHFRCQSDPADLAVINVTIDESTGGNFTGSGNGSDTSGATLNFSLTGSYTSATHLMSGTLTTTNSANSCVRTDTFSTTLTSNDTGYINMVQATACGCAGQIRMIRL